MNVIYLNFAQKSGKYEKRYVAKWTDVYKISEIVFILSWQYR